MLRTHRFLLVALGLFLSPCASAQVPLDDRLFLQPGDDLQNSLEMLSIEAEILSTMENAGGPRHPTSTYLGNDGKSGQTMETSWAAENTLYLKLDPNLGMDAVRGILDEYDFEFEDSFPELGTISVRADLSDFYRNGLSTSEWLAATARIIEQYSTDSRILAVSPEIGVPPDTNVSLDELGLNSLDQAIHLENTASGEKQDWGIEDIQAPALWKRYETPIYKTVGVFDSGFGLHQDIPFIDGVADRRRDHGNHVAGIMCGIHNDSGYRGVLPHCGIYAEPHGYWIDPTQAGPITERTGLMRSVMETFQDFVNDTDDVSVYNVSLGYNWYLLQKADPDFDFANDPNLPDIVENNGYWLYQVLEKANEKNIAIVSAAGNDSRDLDVAFSAKWASPFNYAALTACEARGICNGVVVEAHDKFGKRAVFSNTGGDISCPGVNIHSSLALDKHKKPSPNSYGVMSGTSMASPYCAAGMALLSTFVVDKPVSDMVDCLKLSPNRSDFGVPMMRLDAAMTTCSGTTSATKNK